MLDIGWSEMAVIALIALVVIGPKDLPKVMPSASQWVRKARGLAREFQSGVDDMIREADMEDARKIVESARSLDVRKTIGEAVDPTGALTDEVRDIEKTARDTDVPKKDGDDGAKDAAAATSKAAEAPPPNIAPPHSLTPPPADKPAASTEPAAPAPVPAATAGDNGKQASQT
jgi:sec-independent protein translocase protein TatB